ncbi:MAG: SRPBCC family protein [Acidobacteriota bacterium]
MNKLWTTLAGIGLGAAIMYTLDPQTGRRRRAIARDKVSRAWNKTGDALGALSSDVANRARGIYSETTSKVSREQVPDNVLAERVRSRLGRFSSHPSSMEVTVSGGRVTLRGPILEKEIDDILRAVGDVRGVVDVNDELEVHKESAGVPGLQGPGKRPGAAWGFARYNWSPTHRVVATGVGSGLAVWGLTRRRNPAAVLASLAGMAFALRGATNQELRRIVGLGAGRKAVTIHKTMTFNVPVEQVFQVWDNYESFPKFMTNVKEVRDLGNGRSHWVVSGPAGTTVEWDAEITRRIPNQVIAWKSLPGSRVQHSGIVQFRSLGEDRSKADIRLSYNPVAGAMGHFVASLFGSDPKSELDQDLQRFKQLVEGEVQVTGTTVTGTASKKSRK